MLRPLIPRRHLQHRQPAAMAIRKPGSLIKPTKRFNSLSVGPELIGNGGFVDTSVWTLGLGWSISGGTLIGVPADKTAASQSVTVTAGQRYLFRIDVASVSAGQVVIGLGGLEDPRSIDVAGLYTGLLLCGDTGTLFTLSKDAAFNGKINSVELREVLT